MYYLKVNIQLKKAKMYRISLLIKILNLSLKKLTKKKNIPFTQN